MGLLRRCRMFLHTPHTPRPTEHLPALPFLWLGGREKGARFAAGKVQLKSCCPTLLGLASERSCHRAVSPACGFDQRFSGSAQKCHSCDGVLTPSSSSSSPLPLSLPLPSVLLQSVMPHSSQLKLKPREALSMSMHTCYMQSTLKH